MELTKIVDEMPKDLSQMEKARYIYLELCKKIAYDPRYLMAKSKEQRQEMFDEKADIEEWNKSRAICTIISKLYVQLLQKAGIEARTVHQPDEKYLRTHVFNIFN